MAKAKRVKLTDAERKKIIADYVQCQNYSEVARKHDVSHETVRKIVAKDETCCEKLQQKQEENMQSTIEYMGSQTKKKNRILDKLLDAIETKAENLDDFTNIKDLATAYGIIVDKELKLLEIKANKEQQDNATVNMVEKLLSEIKIKADNNDGI